MDNTLQPLLDKKGNEVYSIQTRQSVYEAIAEMDAKNVGALLVKEGDKVAGIISERDYLRKVILKGRSSKSTLVSEIMSAKVITTTGDSTVEECMNMMSDRRIRHLPVVDGETVIGIISIGDLVGAVIADQKAEIEHLEHYISG